MYWLDHPDLETWYYMKKRLKDQSIPVIIWFILKIENSQTALRDANVHVDTVVL